MTARDPKLRRRKLNADERVLWREVTRSVAPLKRRLAAGGGAEADSPEPKEAAARSKSVVTPMAASAAKPASALAPIDRRLRARLARGSEPIEDRLDLHGRTQAEAHAALLAFLRRAQANDARFVLVITGKGGRGGDDRSERGVLKRQVPLWLRLPEFRRYVAGFEGAHVGHGGEGALYVRVRRVRPR